MQVSDDFKKQIASDIISCDNAYRCGNIDGCYNLRRRLVAKYRAIIPEFDYGLSKSMFDTEGFFVRQDIETLKQKLQQFVALDYQNPYTSPSHKENQDAEGRENVEVTVTTINNISNTNTANVVNSVFVEARNIVEQMTALTADEIDELKRIIAELEEICKSKDTAPRKWAKASKILKWIADKSVDVGIAMLPLFLQIQ